MLLVLRYALAALRALARERSELALENIALRHQLEVLSRSRPRLRPCGVSRPHRRWPDGIFLPHRLSRHHTHDDGFLVEPHRVLRPRASPADGRQTTPMEFCKTTGPPSVQMEYSCPTTASVATTPSCSCPNACSCRMRAGTGLRAGWTTTNPITMPTRRATACSPSSARADLVPACGSSSRGRATTPTGGTRVNRHVVSATWYR